MTTSRILLFGAELNGPTVAGILVVTGYGVFGKHLRNISPLLLGAIIAARWNLLEPTHTTNVLTIPFCTGLAPIAGEYGVFWGVLAGFLHVAIAHHIGDICGGINLYGNGFAAGFVALILVPIAAGLAGKRKSIKPRENV